MKNRALRVAAVTAPLVLALAVPAMAQSSYPPETLSLALVSCELENLIMTVDGAMPNSTVKVTVDFDGVPDIVKNLTTDSVGHADGSFPINPNAGPIIVITVEGVDFDPDVPNGVPFRRVFEVDRRDCPTLPSTGSDALPIGKLAFGATLGGALLIVVALRRRPRHEDEVLTPSA